MVTYQTWTAVAFEAARAKGMTSSQENSQDLVSVLAAVWQDRKTEISEATRSRARVIADEEIHVQGTL